MTRRRRFLRLRRLACLALGHLPPWDPSGATFRCQRCGAWCVDVEVLRAEIRETVGRMFDEAVESIARGFARGSRR